MSPMHAMRSRVKGDGRCMFRSIVRCIAIDQGISTLPESVERTSADFLRQVAVRAIIQNRAYIEDASMVEGKSFEQYVRDISRTHSYGGEPELLMLSRVFNLSIHIYLDDENRDSYRVITSYGTATSPRQTVRLLFNPTSEHYDALLLKKKSRRTRWFPRSLQNALSCFLTSSTKLQERKGAMKPLD